MAFERIEGAARRLRLWLEIAHEQGAPAEAMAATAERALNRLIAQAGRLKPSPDLEADEPNDLEAIRALRPRGPRVISKDMARAALRDRILGAWLGRCAGCILGVPCEGMTREEIAAACESLGQPYPLADYWRRDPKPARVSRLQYGVTPRTGFLKPGLTCAGADDDLVYTLLGLLILEEYGPDFTSADVGQAWLKYLDHACSAEAVALRNLRAGLRPPKTARKDNPFAEWIGADIRSDPWGYAAAGMPELAAEFAWRDASVSHVRNGIYGAMYFSAVIAAALALDDVEEALRVGLTEIPRKSRMAGTVRETLRWVRGDKDWSKTVDRVYRRYAGMSRVHTLNNAALTIAGLMYGKGDLGKTISLTVMGGMDTDCTGATAGSIAGAVLGARKLPARWKRPLGEHAETYIAGHPRFTHTAVARRFLAIATRARVRAGLRTTSP